MAADVPVILAGDYNVAPTELQPQSRAAYQQLLDQGWTDALRALRLDGLLWTFWGYMRHRWPNDKGMRLDHFLLSPTMASGLTEFTIGREARNREDASDHAPVWIEVRAPVMRRARKPAGGGGRFGYGLKRRATSSLDEAASAAMNLDRSKP